jgi:hypothetical protein
MAGSGPFSDLLAKILGVDTPPLLCKTQLYFPLSSLLLHKTVKKPFIQFITFSVGTMHACSAGDLHSVLK